MIKYDCPICDSDEWEYIDHLRSQEYWFVREIREEGEPVGFKICKTCGYVSYDYIDEKRLAAIYDLQRPVMVANNIITCNRKNTYHAQFLDGVKIEGRVLDVGCAQGAFLNWCHEARGITKDQLVGTEYSKAFANFGRHYYGLNIVDEATGKFDFISYYHVLEHVQYPGRELEKIKGMLAPGGLVYISVPTWFDICYETSGIILSDFENYFHLNHVNVFSITSFNNLLAKHGFIPLKVDTELYGYTVLCRVDNSSYGPIKEDYHDIIKIIETQKAAIACLDQSVNKAAEAVKLYPKFPDAYIYWALDRDNMKKFEAQETILKQGLSILPNNERIRGQLARLYFQWDENTPEKKGFYSNNVKRAEKLLRELYTEKPGNEEHLFMLAMIEHKYKGNSGAAIDMLRECMNANPMRLNECIGNIGVICKEYHG